MRDRLEVPPVDRRGRAARAGAGVRGRAAGAGRAGGPHGHRAGAEAGQHRPRVTSRAMLPRACRVAVVTDSTSYLPAELVRERGIAVVPLQVVIGGTSYDEGGRGVVGAPWPRRCAAGSR